MIQVSPVPLQTSNEPGEDSVHTQPSVVEYSLMSAQTVPPPELSQVSQNVMELRSYVRYHVALLLWACLQDHQQPHIKYRCGWQRSVLYVCVSVSTCNSAFDV